MVRSGWNSNSSEILCMSLLHASIKRIRSKTTEKRWRHHLPHYKSMRAFCCHGNQSWSNLPQNLMQPFPHSNDATYKILSRLAIQVQDIKVQKCEIFVTQGQATPKWEVWFGPKSNSTKILCLSWLPATLMMIRSKMNELAWRHHFPIISLWEVV